MSKVHGSSLENAQRSEGAGGFKKVAFDQSKVQNLPELYSDKCMDKSKITRKQSKASKHGHENQKKNKAEEAKDPKP
ncbi:hypothetical protein Tco_0994903 [Tanacetum coccineum]